MNLKPLFLILWVSTRCVFIFTVYVVVVCLSVCYNKPVGIETTKRIKLVLVWKFIRPLCCKEIRVSAKNKGFSHCNCPKFYTPLEKFRSCCQQSSRTVELVDHTYDGRRVARRTHMSVDRNALSSKQEASGHFFCLTHNF